MAGYFGGGGMSPGMGFTNPMGSGMNPQMMAMLAAMQNQGAGGQGGPAPQMPMMPKSPTNAGAMPAPIASQPPNPMIAQLMQNPGMLQGLLRALGGGGMGGGLGGGSGLMMPGTSTPMGGGFATSPW